MRCGRLLRELFHLLYALGALWALGLVVIAAVIARRFWLALAVSISGVLAWLLARILNEAATAPHYPLSRLALVVAVVSAASPFVARPARRLGGLLAWGVALSALCLSSGAPRDVVGAAVLGWGVSGLVHLIAHPSGTPPAARSVPHSTISGSSTASWSLPSGGCPVRHSCAPTTSRERSPSR